MKKLFEIYNDLYGRYYGISYPKVIELKYSMDKTHFNIRWIENGIYPNAK